MGKLGKILAPIVAVLAIAAAVLNFLVSDGFKKYQERASIMAKGLVETGAKLDAQTNTGKASAVKFSAAAPGGVKESGTLSYADFKADSNKFNSTVSTVTEIADKVVAQRNDLTEAVKDISIKLGMKEDDIAADDMKDVSTYQAKITLAKSYVDAYEQRDKEFISYIKKYASSLGRSAGYIDRKPAVKTEKVAPPKKEASEDAEEGEEAAEAEPVETQVAKFESNSSSLEALNRAIIDMKNCRDSYEKAIRNVKSAISNYGDWKADVSYISERNYQTVLAALAGDLAGINRKLGELNQVKNELNRTKDDLSRSRNEVESLKQKNAEAQKNNEILSKRNKELASLLGGEEAIEEVLDDASKPEVKPEDVKEDTIGKVLLDNKEWNYVITDLGNKKVAVGTELVIATDDGTYLASGKVIKAEPLVSLVEITRRGEKGNIQIGAKVMVSSKGVKDSDD